MCEVCESKRGKPNLGVVSLGREWERGQPAAEARDEMGDDTVDMNVNSCRNWLLLQA